MDKYRNYINSARQDVVENNYARNHREMTLELVKEKKEKWLSFTKGEYSIKEVLSLVNTLIDDSDPDVEVENTIHAFQCAEKIRKDYPNEDWLHLTALIHDLGKVLSVWGEPQHFVVGDTYVMGCKFSNDIVFSNYFRENPDFSNKEYNTKYGIYKKKCNLSNLTMSWGHDEYLYRVLEYNKCTLPEQCLQIIRYHSFYPWHRDGAYKYLISDKDNKELLPILKKFSHYDLYSKTDDVPDCEKLWEDYYAPLCEKYGISGKLKW